MRRSLLWLVPAFSGLLVVQGGSYLDASAHQTNGLIPGGQSVTLNNQRLDGRDNSMIGTDQQAPRDNLLGLDSHIKVGVAFSGGAAKGLAHIGVLKALEEVGVRVDYIAGSSMGALVGAAYASGIAADSLERIALQTDWMTLIKLFFPTFSSAGLIRGNRIVDYLDDLYGSRNIEDLALPFTATATDLSSGDLLLIDRGNVAEAVRASISIPVVFAPVFKENRCLVDGALVNAVPVDVVRNMGAEFVIAVNVLNLVTDSIDMVAFEDEQNNEGQPKPADETASSEDVDYRGISRIIYQTVMITEMKLAQFQLDICQPDLIIEPNAINIRGWDFHKAEQVIDVGYQSAKKAFNEFKINGDKTNSQKAIIKDER